MSEEGEP